MTEASPVDLTYGHPGEASYDGEQHEWIFSRDLDSDCKHFQIIQENLSLRNHSFASTKRSDKQNAQSRSQNAKKLAKQIPVLVPAAQWLPDLALESEAIETWNTKFDSHVAELMAFGKLLAASEGSSDAQIIPIAAVASGSCGDALKLFIPNQKTMKRQDCKRIDDVSNTFEHGIETSWTETRGPIQQLCFAEGIEALSTCWLAIRYYTATSMHRLSLTAERAYQGPRDHMCSVRDKSAVSAINCTATLTIPIERTGNTPHAHICFDPGGNELLGIVDQKGRWSIWTIRRNSQRSELWEAVELVTGSLYNNWNEGAKSGNPSYDGWHRLLWIKSSHTLILASRTDLVAFDIDFPSKRLRVPQIDLSESGEWLLDLKNCSLDLSHAILLTSTRLIWLRLDLHQIHEGPDAALIGKRLLSWRHFGDPGDISLKINVLEIRDVAFVVLYSRIRSDLTLYIFSLTSPPNRTVRLVQSPSLLSRHQDPMSSPKVHTNLRSSSRGTLVITTLSCRPDWVNNCPQAIDSGSTPNIDDVLYFRIAALDNHLSVSEMLVSSELTNISPTMLPPDEKTLIDPLGTIESLALAGFTASDEEINFLSAPNLQRMFVDQKRLLRSGDTGEQEDRWTLDLSWLPKELQRHMSAGKTNFVAALDSLQTLMEQETSYDSSFPESLLELSNAELLVEDVDAASESFGDLLQKVKNAECEEKQVRLENQPRIGISLGPSIPWPWGVGDCLILSRVYETLVRHWLAPLPSRAPSRARVAVERMARAIAAKVCLAAHYYPRKPYAADRNIMDDVDENKNAGPSEFTLTLRRKRSSSTLSEKGKGKGKVQLPDSHSLMKVRERESGDITPSVQSQRGALPTPELTPSAHSSSPFLSTTEIESLASQRLRSLVSMKPQVSHADSTAIILDHWEEGANPWSYDWENTQQALDIESEAPDVDEFNRTEKRSKAKRRNKKRKVEDIGTSSQQRPAREANSQPIWNTAVETSESNQVIAPMVVSQGEPRIYGDRANLGTRKPREKRKAGFK